jgi:hypothetical protein
LLPGAHHLERSAMPRRPIFYADPPGDATGAPQGRYFLIFPSSWVNSGSAW